jgi:hypothetical protein
MPLVAAFSAYRNQIACLNGYITKAFTQDAAGRYFLAPQEQSFIAEFSFLKAFIAWEGFLEEVFLQYLLGTPSLSGKVALRYASPFSEEHARSMLVGNLKFVDWTNPQVVRTLAAIYFEKGEPISTIISSIEADLIDLKTIRNAAAHHDSTTGKKLDALASRKLNRLCVNISVSDFILSQDPNNGATGTILENYILKLDVAAENLVNWF